MAKSAPLAGPQGQSRPGARSLDAPQALRSPHSHVGLQAEQSARWHGGEQQRQGQGHRAARRPRLGKERHRARGPAPGPSCPQSQAAPAGPPNRRLHERHGPGLWAHEAQPQVPAHGPTAGRRRCGASGLPPAAWGQRQDPAPGAPRPPVSAELRALEARPPWPRPGPDPWHGHAPVDPSPPPPGPPPLPGPASSPPTAPPGSSPLVPATVPPRGPVRAPHSPPAANLSSRAS